MDKKKKQGELASIVMLVCTSPAEWEGTTESSESLESTAITEAADRSSSSSMRISFILLKLRWSKITDPSAALLADHRPSR
jgi:hypothetical protein